METERDGEGNKESMLNGGTKRRRNISSLRNSIGLSSPENGVDDHDRDRNRVFMNSVEWNQAFMNSQKNKKNKKKHKKMINEKSREEGDHRKNNRSRFYDGSFSSPPVVTVDEIVIGVSVPRKIRSASVKRLNRNWSFRNAGFDRGLSHHRRFLPSSEVVVAGQSEYCASPQNGLWRKNMKSHVPERELPKAVGDSSLIQDDVEFEVIEALFDLMNQTHSESDRSKKSEMDLVCPSGSLKEQVAKKKCIKTSNLLHKSDRNNGSVKKGMCLSALNEDFIAEDENNIVLSKYSVNRVKPRSTMNLHAGKEKVFDKRDAESLNDSKTMASKKRVVAPQAVEKKEDETEVESNNFSQGSLKHEHYASNSSGISELVEDGEEPNQLEGLISGGQESALNTSLPSPIFDAAWARDLPRPGSVPPFQIFMPDRNARPLTALPRTPFVLSQCTRKRCITHQYIAHNIFCHQQLIMNFTTLPANSDPASIYKAKTPTPDALISKLIMTDGDEFKGEFMGKKMFSVFGGYETFGAENNVNVSNDKQLMFQQASQQITTANILCPDLADQLGHHHTLMVPPTNQNASTLSSNSGKEAVGNSSLSPVVNYNHMNFPSKPIPPYMTIFPNNGYPSPFSTADRREQAPAMPYVSQTQTQQSLS